MVDARAFAIASHYISTACIHDNHDGCRLECKTCAKPCRCSCHGPDPTNCDEGMEYYTHVSVGQDVVLCCCLGCAAQVAVDMDT